jgi:hypothetical protein
MTSARMTLDEVADEFRYPSSEAVLKCIDRYNRHQPEALRIKTYRRPGGRVLVDRESFEAACVRREAIREAR